MPAFLVGCGSGYGPDVVPVPLASITLPTEPYQLISKLGCAKQDVDLNTGLTLLKRPATDDAPCINAALAKATPKNPVVLVQDGASLVSGIHGPASGNWSIYGLGGGFHALGEPFGTGFYQKAGTNDDVIHNGPPGAGCSFGFSDPARAIAGPPPARGSHIVLHNFAINGNRGDGYSGNSTHGKAQGVGNDCWYIGINMMDMNDVDISGITFFNTSSYNLRLSNVGSSTVSHSIFANSGLYPANRLTAENDDGTHINGPANDVTISDNLYVTGDDAIALNAPEGWGGLIQNITIKNSTSRSAHSLVRLYTRSENVLPGRAIPEIRDVTIQNYNGTGDICADFGLEVPRTMTRTATISHVKWSDSTCTADWGNLLMENVADVEFSNFTWRTAGMERGFMNSLFVAAQAEQLTFNNVTIDRGDKPNPTALIEATIATYFYPVGSLHVNKVDINGLKVTRGHMQDVIHTLPASVFDEVNATQIDFSNITTMSNNPSGIGVLNRY
jgi:hypothetical protein